MALLPEEVAEQLPDLYGTAGLGPAALALVKFFTPDSNLAWYGSEYDPTTKTFYGLVIGVEEPGISHFSLEALEVARGPLGIPVERDEHFEPASLGELQEHYRKEGHPK